MFASLLKKLLKTKLVPEEGLTVAEDMMLNAGNLPAAISYYLIAKLRCARCFPFL